MSLEAKLEIYGLTNVGRKRSHNEDSIGSDAGTGVAVLADGMGGYKAGEVASAIAVNMLLDDIRGGLKRIEPGEWDNETGISRRSQLVKSAIERANETIFQTAQSQPQCRGMGTTAVVTVFHEDRLTVAHVGDSRLYRLRENHFEQVTSDHSLLQELVDKGFYTAEEAKRSLNKNLVTRALGIDLHVNPDVQEDVVKPGDIYLLCSDGLSDEVDDACIHETIKKHEDCIEEAAKTLVQLANEHGGQDNISVILARTRGPLSARKSWYSRVFDWL